MPSPGTRNRVQFVYVEWTPAPAHTRHGYVINTRDVMIDSEYAGVLFGVNPYPTKPTRPTGFVFVDLNGYALRFARLSEARATLEDLRTPH
jgi:hypothetical protein